MLSEFLKGLRGPSAGIFAGAGLLLFLQSGAIKDVIGAVKGEVSPKEYATREYVDVRINDLNALSELRNKTAVEQQATSTKALTEQMATLTRAVETLSNRMWTITQGKHVAVPLKTQSSYAVYREGL